MSRYSRFPRARVAGALAECGEKQARRRRPDPVGLRGDRQIQDLQDEVVAVARQYNIRLMGPNIYGFYDTPKNLCATFCTPYDVKGKVALSSQSGGVGMAIVGFSRSAKMGVSAIVGLGNKSDIDEDDLLTFFEQDDATQAIAMHFEDLKDGRTFAKPPPGFRKKSPSSRSRRAAPRWARAPRAPIPRRWRATTGYKRTCSGKAAWCGPQPE